MATLAYFPIPENSWRRNKKICLDHVHRHLVVVFTNLQQLHTKRHKMWKSCRMNKICENDNGKRVAWFGYLNSLCDMWFQCIEFIYRFIICWNWKQCTWITVALQHDLASVWSLKCVNGQRGKCMCTQPLFSLALPHPAHHYCESHAYQYRKAAASIK